jgi:hypothetical protein
MILAPSRPQSIISGITPKCRYSNDEARTHKRSHITAGLTVVGGDVVNTRGAVS